MTGNPLLLWMLALVAAGVGVRRRRRPEGRGGGEPVVGVLRRVAAIPAPSALTARAASDRLLVDLRAAGFGDASLGAVVARARAGAATAGLAGAVALGVVEPLAIVFGVGVACCGWALPVAWAGRRARERRHRLVADLPDLIDVVVLCADAGLALEPALRHAARRLAGPCVEEVRIMLGQLDLGTPRRDAYRELGARTGTTELTGLVSALLQAEELGTPINAALARQADLLRANRRQAVRDRSARAAPKVQLVVAMVMVPASLLLIVGVMVIQLVGQIGGVVGAAP